MNGREWLRWLGHVLAVLLMMVVGFSVLMLAVMANPANEVPGAADVTEVTDIGAARVLLGMLALFLLPFYRRAPLVLICAGAFCAVVLGTDPFVLAVGLAVWIGRAERPWQWWVVGVGSVAIGVNTARIFQVIRGMPDDDRQFATTVALAVLLLSLSLIVGIGMWSRQRRRAGVAAADAQAAQRNSEHLSSELIRQREREELAREVHDTLASRLSVIALQTGSLEDAARDVGNAALDDAMRTVRANATNALTDLRSLLTSLREGGAPGAAPQSEPGGVSDLQDIFADATAAGLTIAPFVVVDGYGEAPDALQRAVTRITQEAFTNALRHSSDRVVMVRMEGAPRVGLRLEFANEYGYGPGSFGEGSHTGLLGIEERARLVGGTVTRRRSDGRFTLTVHLPWNTE